MSRTSHGATGWQTSESVSERVVRVGVCSYSKVRRGNLESRAIWLVGSEYDEWNVEVDVCMCMYVYGKAEI